MKIQFKDGDWVGVRMRVEFEGDKVPAFLLAAAFLLVAAAVILLWSASV